MARADADKKTDVYERACRGFDPSEVRMGCVFTGIDEGTR